MPPVAPVTAAPPPVVDDAWLRATAAPIVEPTRPIVDWTPEAESRPQPAPAADDRGVDEIPDVASLDTLLPDHPRGGSINPGR